MRIVIAFLFILEIFAFAQNENLYDFVPVDIISLDIREKPFSYIIEGIREQTGANIVYDEEIKEILVSIKLIQIHWKKALYIIAKDHNCLVEKLDDNVLKVSRPSKITLKFDNVDIQDVVEKIASIANQDVIISEKVQGNISIQLENLDWYDALEKVAQLHNAVVVEYRRIYRIEPAPTPSEMKAKLKTEKFHLLHIKQEQNYNRSLVLQIFLEKDLTPYRGEIIYDEENHTLTITEIEPKLKRMRQIIQSFKEFDLRKNTFVIQLEKEPLSSFLEIKKQDTIIDYEKAMLLLDQLLEKKSIRATQVTKKTLSLPLSTNFVRYRYSQENPLGKERSSSFIFNTLSLTSEDSKEGADLKLQFELLKRKTETQEKSEENEKVAPFMLQHKINKGQALVIRAFSAHGKEKKQIFFLILPRNNRRAW